MVSEDPKVKAFQDKETDNYIRVAIDKENKLGYRGSIYMPKDSKPRRIVIIPRYKEE